MTSSSLHSGYTKINHLQRQLKVSFRVRTSRRIKGTLSLKIFSPYMKEITPLNIINKVKISFSPPFTPKIGDLAEIVRLEGPKKQAIVSCSGPEKQATSLL